MGECSFSPQEIQNIIDSMVPNFLGCYYNLFTKFLFLFNFFYNKIFRNCNHFSNELCLKLVGKSIPRL